MEKKRIEQINQLKNASPLEITKCIEEIELYDMKSSQEVIDEIYKEFENSGDLTDNIIKPVFLSVIDGILEGTGIGKTFRKKGVTASRLLTECEQFNYEKPSKKIEADGYQEYKNMRDETGYDANYSTLHDSKRSAFKGNGKYVNSEMTQNYTSAGGENKSANDYYSNLKVVNKDGEKVLAKDDYKDRYFNENKTADNEYIADSEGNKTVHRSKDNPDQRRKDNSNKHTAETDHIVPLQKVHEQFKGNFALNDQDIREIANQDGNFAVTSKTMNASKKDDYNEDYVKRANVELTKNDKKLMKKKSKEAQKSIDSKANEKVMKNLIGKGNAETKKIHKKNASAAANQAKDGAVGDLIMFIIKPLYYEMTDIFKNGLEEGVDADSAGIALKIRFGRIKTYVMENAKNFFGDSILDFIKGFVSSIIEGFIGVFVGVFKQVLKIVKEGIKIFVKSGKILFGEDSNNMSAAEKGDAIIKILGGSVIAISGVGIEALINKIGIEEPWSIILSSILAGVASTLFMYILDKADLFSVKAEKRHARIEEVFKLRVEDMNNVSITFDDAAFNTLKEQYIEFENLQEEIEKALDDKDIDQVNAKLYKMVDFMNVELEYKNSEEFVDFFDSASSLSF